MTTAHQKQEYTEALPDISSTLSGPFSGEGSNTANAALLRATLAFDRIERHEFECTRRWSTVIKLILLMLAQLGGLLLFLLSDKLGWFL